MNIDLWFPAIMTLAGVIVGSLLAPLTSSAIENRRIKKSIKPKLTKLIYQLYRLRGQAMAIYNHLELYKAGIRLTDRNLTNRSLTVEKIADIEREHAILREAFKESSINRNKNYDEILIIESDIYALIEEIKTHYGDTKYLAIKESIHEPINSSERIELLYSYETLTNETYSDASIRMPIKLNSKMLDLRSQASDLLLDLTEKL